MVQKVKDSGWKNRLWRRVALVVEGEVVVEHSVCCTGGTQLDRSELGTAAGFEAG